jgi:hypothetical protein
MGALVRDLCVRELVTMTASLFPAPLEVDDVLQLVGIEAIAERRTQKLSGGETQRVRFALALAPDPDLLVLDESTVAMDVEGRHPFWQAMRRFAEGGKTVLFATHRARERRTETGLPRPDERERCDQGGGGGSAVRRSTYVRYELVRNFRNRRFFLFIVGFPLVLYLLIAAPNRHEHDLAGSGISRRSTSWSG